MSRLFSLPIRVHLILLVVVSILPAMGIIAYSGLKEERALRRKVQADSVQVLDAIHDGQEEVAAAMEQLLSVLARLPEIQKRDPKAASEILHEVHQLNPQYAILSVADVEGNLFASIIPFENITVSDRKYFQDVLKSRAFSVGEYAVTRVNRRSVLHYACPSFDSEGRLRAVVLAGYDLTHFDRVLARVGLPRGSEVVILDHRGIVLYDSKNPERMGMSDEPAVFDRMRSEMPEHFFTVKKGAAEAGEVYMYTSVRLAGDKPPYMYIRVSFLGSELYGPVRRFWIRQSLLIGTSALLAIAVAWGLGSYIITDRIKRLMQMVHEVEQGEYVTTGFGDFGGELGKLTRAFDRMRESLAKREMERNEAEKALREKTEELDRFFDLVPDLLMIGNVDGCYRRVNPQWERTLGFSRSELEGQFFYDHIHPDDIESTRQAVAQLKAQKRVIKFVNRFIDKEGNFRWIEWHAIPQGNLFYAAGRDITEEREAVESLKEREEQLRTLINAMPDIVCFKDGEGRWLEANDFDLQLFELIGVDYWGKKDSELAAYSEFYRDAFWACEESDERTWEFGRFSRGDEIIPCPDGSALVFDIIKVPTFNPDGSRKGLVVIGRDITERRRAEEQLQALNRSLEQRVKERTAQLEAANRELEAFSYSVSHDLKAPLRALDGFSQILLEDYADRLDDRGLDYLARIRSASQRMGQLIEDMLKLSRITQKEMKLAVVDLSSLARKIVSELRAENPARKVDFVVPPSLPVRGDASLLQIALQNLLGNAWKFTAKKSEARIELGSMQEEGRTVYFVRDNGAGFNMDYANKLFQAFQRLHRKDEFEGTGIGLAIVKRIVMKHGGEIWVQGESGQGATFYFTL